MNKSPLRTLITIAVIIAVGIIALVVWVEIASYHKLTIKDGGIAASYYQVVNGANGTAQSIKSDQTYSVKNGQYCAAPTDTNYNDDPICVTVKNGDATLTVDPAYSTDHLSILLTSDLVSQLTAIIGAKYQPIIGGYMVDSGQLFDKGEWYATTLTAVVAPQDRGDVYRTILKKDGDTWSVVVPPQIMVSKFDYPKIPLSILTGANQLPGNS